MSEKFLVFKQKCFSLVGLGFSDENVFIYINSQISNQKALKEYFD